LAVSVVIWIFIDKQFVSDVLRQKNQDLYIMCSLFILLFFYIATTVLTRMDSVNVLRQAGKEWTAETNRTGSLKSTDVQINQLKNDSQSRPREVVQIYQLSNILELTTGIEAGLVVADPRYLSMFSDIQNIQFQPTLGSKFDIIIEDFQLDDSF